MVTSTRPTLPKMVYPGFVAHDEDWRSAWLVVGGLRDAAVESGQAEEFERARSNFGSVKAVGAFTAFVQDFDLGGGGDAVEDMILSGVVEEFGGVAGAAACLADWSACRGWTGTSGGWRRSREKARRCDQDILDCAEDGGGGSDA
jgi:hypothetical protein